jgi:hypothetical protein
VAFVLERLLVVELRRPVLYSFFPRFTPDMTTVTSWLLRAQRHDSRTLKSGPCLQVAGSWDLSSELENSGRRLTDALHRVIPGASRLSNGQ